MKRFAELYQVLDRSTATSDKREALLNYLRDAPPRDMAWAIYLLRGGKVGGARQKIASTTELRQWISEASGLDLWLVEDSYHHVGDLAETLTLLMPPSAQAEASDVSLANWIERRILSVANGDLEVRRAMVMAAWRELPNSQRLVFNKLLTGALRIGVSQGLVQQAISELTGMEPARIAQRMMGKWTPTEAFVNQLLAEEGSTDDEALPYPFFLASPLEKVPDSPVDEWLFEWKWDGIRLQLIRRGETVVLWSRGEERLDGRFPELEVAARALPNDVVLDGELVAWHTGRSPDAPEPFSKLQTRIQRLKPSEKMRTETPVRLIVYDLLECDGEDWRARPLSERRAKLQELLDATHEPAFEISKELMPASWEQAAVLRESARDLGVEGLMVKRRDSAYAFGRKRGDWWKWKVDPMTIDAVLIYAQAGHGRRSALHTDYTFALWNDDNTLVPVAKAYSGLTDAEILKLDKWIRANTLERFGPVRSVKGELVFELAFEGVNISKRHKSGIAVRFPRILRWRNDKPAAEADRLSTLQAMAT